MLLWRVPAPNEALLISGSKSRRQDTQFRIITGHGAFVLPVIRRARTLSLALQEAEIVEDCITTRDLEITRAGFLAETEEARARAAQAGPLAEARASQEVTEQQTALARRRAELAEQRLEAEVRRPADAEAYRQRALAEAQRDQAKFGADADAYRAATLAKAEAEAARIRADAAAYTERATAQAEAEANSARAASLAGGNQELIAASQVVTALPALVTAAAQGIAASNLTILNGADGVSEMLTGLVGQGLTILDALKRAGVVAAPRAEGAPAPTGLRSEELATSDEGRRRLKGAPEAQGSAAG